MANNFAVKDYGGVSRTIKTTDTAGVHTTHHNVDTLPALPAGTNHVGQINQPAATVTVNPTVSTSPAYTAGDSVGGKITITGALRAAGQPTSLNSVCIIDEANQSPEGTLLIFDADPTAATITDNAAFVFSTDVTKTVAKISVAASDYVTINSVAVAMLTGLGAVVEAASGTTLYAAFVVTSTPTFAATDDLQLTFGFVQS